MKILRLLPVLALFSVGLARGEEVPADRTSAPPEAVVAKVGDQEIRVADVLRFLRGTVGANHVAPEALAFLQAQALDQLVSRALIVTYLDREQIKATTPEIDAAVKKVEDQVGGPGPVFDQALAQRGLTKAELRDQLAWEIRWSKYIEKRVNERTLEDHFNIHHKDFDGTEVRVSHILLRATSARDLSAFDTLLNQARQIREEIAAGKISFDAAAKKFSAGPSRQQGGDLGFIPRHDRMVEAFSSAAFALDKGQISEPVTTQFGIHLILCTDVKPGKKTWQEAHATLVPAVVQELFNALAGGLRPNARIEFTGVMPYLDRRTGSVVAGGPKPTN